MKYKDEPIFLVKPVSIIAVCFFLAAGANPLVAQGVPALSDKEIEARFDELGADEFKVRDSATRQLLSQGKTVLEKLQQLLEARGAIDLETSWRLTRIMDKLEFESTCWQVTYPAGDTNLKPARITFEPDRQFTSSNSRHDPWKSHWTSRGGWIKFSYNNRTAVYTGEKVSEKVVEGTASNGSKSWAFRLRRIY